MHLRATLGSGVSLSPLSVCSSTLPRRFGSARPATVSDGASSVSSVEQIDVRGAVRGAVMSAKFERACQMANPETADDAGTPVAKSPRASGRLLLAVSILVPAALWGLAAWLDYETTTARAREYVLTTTNALAEQANEALQSADLIL